MNNNHINYVELKARNLEEVKVFYSRAFGWKFVDYGPDYVAFSESGLEGGFERSDEEIVNGTLIVLYHENLESAKANIEVANGTIIKDIFSFPGGQRFHFQDPSGNELAVWSDR